MFDWPEIVNKLIEEAKPFLRVRGDIEHTRIAHEFTQKLMKCEGGKKEIIEPAIILHDVGWSAITPNQIKQAFGVRASGDESERLNRIHEVEGVKIARSILVKLEFEESVIKRILSIIDRHDSGRDAGSVEEQIVRDCDKLWRCSRVGFWHELKRQDLSRRELFDYLYVRRDKWFFTKKGRELFISELESRKREIN